METQKKINKTLNTLEKKGRITPAEKNSICLEVTGRASSFFEKREKNAEKALQEAWQEVKAKYPELLEEAEEAKPDFEILEKYLEAGFTLYAFHFYKDRDGKEKSSFCNIKGYGEKLFSEKIKIRTPAELKAFISAGVTNFKFFPEEKKYFCLDIDCGHDNGIDGLKSFQEYLKNEKAENMPLFKKLESFPAYTRTPSGGLHLYFKNSFLENRQYMGSIAPNVEIKAGKLSLTAAGSVKKGKVYRLYGDLLEAPELPAFFLKKALKIREEVKAEPGRKYYSPAGKKQSYSLEKLAEYGRQNAERAGQTTPHYFCVYIGRRMLQANISRETIISFLLNYSLTRDHDPSDTRSTIISL